MSFDWKSWIARIDDMNLRERAMLFGSVALVVVVAAHVTLIDRLLGNQKRLIERVTRDQSQLKSVREQLQLIQKENQPQGRHPDELAIAELERKIKETEKKVAARQRAFVAPEELPVRQRDRKSTRLNSSHANISYAVFCLKKKKKNITYTNTKI